MTASPRSATPLTRQTLGDAYVVALEAYLACPEETALSGAYELGRQALHDGLGPLDLVSLHESALEQVRQPLRSRAAGPRCRAPWPSCSSRSRPSR